MFFIHYSELYKHYGSRNRSKWVTTMIRIITARQNPSFSYLMLGRKLYFLMFAFGVDKLVHTNQSHCKYRKHFKIPDRNDPWNIDFPCLSKSYGSEWSWLLFPFSSHPFAEHKGLQTMTVCSYTACSVPCHGGIQTLGWLLPNLERVVCVSVQIKLFLPTSWRTCFLELFH